MMKATLSVRIIRVSQGSLFLEPNEDQSSSNVQPITVQKQPDYQSAHQEVSRELNSSSNVDMHSESGQSFVVYYLTKGEW
jgi:hypothetical protein